MNRRLVGSGVVVVLALLALVLFSHWHPVALAGAPTDRILVEKSAHRMSLLRDGTVLRSYRVALGRGGLANKERSGDNRVPEGVYRVAAHQPHSAFHLALRVGYPTPSQVAIARARGIDPGGDIMVHGLRNGFGWIGAPHRWLDWTKGCIGVTDEEIDEIYRAVPDGAVIEIRR